MTEETIRCPFCVDGVWYRNREFEEPYGYPYRPQTINCEVCHGSKAILKSEVKNHSDKEQISEEERGKILASLPLSESATE